MATKQTIAATTKNTAQAGGMPLWLNRTMAWILRSPLHRLVSGSILLITFTGRKSSKVYTTPVSYTRQGAAIIAFTHSSWWKNLQGGAPVTLWLQGKEIQGQAEAITGNPEMILPYLRTHLQQVTRDARFYDVKLEANGQPNEADLVKAAHNSVLIRITPAVAAKEESYGVA